MNTTTMKTIKTILLIFVISCSSMLMATNPVYQTSSASYKSIGAGGGAAAGVGGASMRSGAAVSAPGAAMGVSIPTVSFHSTSAMTRSGSNLINTDSYTVVGANNLPNNSGSGFGGRRNAADEEDTPPADDPPGPNENPIGDAILPMLLLAAGYALWQWRRKKAAESGYR